MSLNNVTLSEDFHEESASKSFTDTIQEGVQNTLIFLKPIGISKRKNLKTLRSMVEGGADQTQVDTHIETIINEFPQLKDIGKEEFRKLLNTYSTHSGMLNIHKREMVIASIKKLTSRK